MFIDSRTLRDLEVLHSRDGGPSIADALDRTVTRAGRRAFRARLAAPDSRPERIRESLESCRFLAEGGFRFPVHPHLLDEIEAYLSSRISSLADHGVATGWRGAPHAAWVAFRYPELAALAREGVRTTHALIVQTGALLDAIESGGPPPGLARLVGRLRGVLAGLSEALPAGDGSFQVLSADRALRDRHRDDLLALIECLGELDAALSAAALLDAGFCIPGVDDETEALVLEGAGVWHPFLSDPVPNPLSLGGGRNLLFLTGPNMAGKTTYLRAVVVATHLAHCGLPVPARSFRFTPLDALFVTLSPEDHLRSGLSLFKAEVVRAREVVERVVSGARTLAVFDEAFRGTNVRDAREASRTLIRGCARAPRSGFIFSSHLAELGEDLAEDDRIRFGCFEGRLDAGEVSFDHELRPGVSDQRLGLHILRGEGLDRLLEAVGDGRSADRVEPSEDGSSAHDAPDRESGPGGGSASAEALPGSGTSGGAADPAPRVAGPVQPPSLRRLIQAYPVEITTSLRATGLWVLGRAILAGTLLGLGSHPLAQDLRSSIVIVALVGALVWLDIRRRNEDLLLANLSVPRRRLLLIGVGPPAVFELLLLFIPT